MSENPNHPSERSSAHAGTDPRATKLATLKREYRERTPGWSRWLFSISISLMVLGVGLSIWSATTTSPDQPAPTASDARSAESGGNPLAPQSFTGQTPAASAAKGNLPADPSRPAWTQGWGPTVFRLGFSFFIAFAIAYTLRLFLTWALVLIGVVAVLIILLQYLGMISFNWNDVESQSQDAAGWAQNQFGSFMDFAKGVLPSSAAAAAGLFAGWRRK